MTDTETKPKKNLCTECGEKRRVPGDTSTLGKALGLCIRCIRESLRKKKCPFCGNRTDSKAHQAECVEAVAA